MGSYHCVLDHVDVSYDIVEGGSSLSEDGASDGGGAASGVSVTPGAAAGGRVILRGACPNQVQSQQRGLGLLETVTD